MHWYNDYKFIFKQAKFKGNQNEALQYYKNALSIRQKNDSLKDKDRYLAVIYGNMGEIYREMGDYSNALSFHEKARDIQQQIYSSDHVHLATTYNNMALVYKSLNDPFKALSYYKKALAIEEKLMPSLHPLLATTNNNIAQAYQHIGDYAQALVFYQKSLEIIKKKIYVHHQDRHPQVLWR